jgi:hypothetical protein
MEIGHSALLYHMVMVIDKQSISSVNWTKRVSNNY